MRPIIGPAARTPEWYALRRNTDDPKFGATDAAALLGVSRYKTARHVYEEFIAPPEPLDNEAMRVGRHLEPAVQSLYAEVADMLVIRDVPAALHPTLPVFASVDSFAFRARGCAADVYAWSEIEESHFPSDGEGADVLEIKTSFSPAIADQLGEDGSDWVPNEWLMQVQQQMGVVGLPTATIAVLLYGRLRTFRVEANADIIAAIYEAAVEMRERILERDPPPPDWEHGTTPDLVRAMRHDLTSGSIECDAYATELWIEQRALAEHIDTLQKDRAIIKAKFEAWLIEHEAASALLPSGRQVVRREVSRAGYTVEPKTYWELREMKARKQ